MNTRDPRFEQMCARRLAALGIDTGKNRVTVEWSQRLKTTSGLAYWSDLRIVLSAPLLWDKRKVARRVVLHELAHFVSKDRSGEKIAPHGPEWQQACADLGIPGEDLYHDLPVKRRKVEPKHYYMCRGCDRHVTRVRPFKERKACLRCCKKHNGGEYKEEFRLIKI